MEYFFKNKDEKIDINKIGTIDSAVIDNHITVAVVTVNQHVASVLRDMNNFLTNHLTDITKKFQDRLLKDTENRQASIEEQAEALMPPEVKDMMARIKQKVAYKANIKKEYARKKKEVEDMNIEIRAKNKILKESWLDQRIGHDAIEIYKFKYGINHISHKHLSWNDGMVLELGKEIWPKEWDDKNLFSVKNGKSMDRIKAHKISSSDVCI